MVLFALHFIKLEVFDLILDKRILTAFVLTSFVIAGTALASFRTTSSSQSIDIGEPATLTAGKKNSGPAVIITPIPVSEITKTLSNVDKYQYKEETKNGKYDYKKEYKDGKYEFKEEYKGEGKGNHHKKNHSRD